jgi:hypothetical protein
MKIELFKEYDSATNTLSNSIQSITDFSIPSTKFTASPLTNVDMTAVSYIVQESAGLTISFTTDTAVPGTNTNSEFEQAIHVMYP